MKQTSYLFSIDQIYDKINEVKIKARYFSVTKEDIDILDKMRSFLCDLLGEETLKGIPLYLYSLLDILNFLLLTLNTRNGKRIETFPDKKYINIKRPNEYEKDLKTNQNDNSENLLTEKKKEHNEQKLIKKQMEKIDNWFKVKKNIGISPDDFQELKNRLKKWKLDKDKTINPDLGRDM